MLGTDALILLRDKTSSSFLLFIPVCDATSVLLHLANGYLTEVGMKTPPAG